MATGKTTNRVLALGMVLWFGGIELASAQSANKPKAETMSQVHTVSIADHASEQCPCHNHSQAANKPHKIKSHKYGEGPQQPEPAPQNVVEYRGP